MIQKLINSFKYSMQGFHHAYMNDRSFQMEVHAFPIMLFVAWLLWPLSGIEMILLSFGYLFILTTELINTSLERMLERLHPEYNELIGASKDIASAAVFVALSVAGIIIAVLLLVEYGYLEIF